MTFGAQRIFALLAVVVFAAGGDLCTCAAGASGMRAVASPTPAACHSSGASTPAYPPAAPARHACCGASGPSGAARHAPADPAAQASASSPSHAVGSGLGDATGGSPSHGPPPHCEHCNPHLAPAPDAKATAPPTAVTAVAEAGPDGLADLLTPAAPPAAPGAAESPPAAGGRTLFALRCSLLD